MADTAPPDRIAFGDLMDSVGLRGAGLPAALDVDPPPSVEVRVHCGLEAWAMIHRYPDGNGLTAFTGNPVPSAGVPIVLDGRVPPLVVRVVVDGTASDYPLA